MFTSAHLSQSVFICIHEPQVGMPRRPITAAAQQLQSLIGVGAAGELSKLDAPFVSDA